MSWVATAVVVVGAGTAAYGASQAGKGSGQTRDASQEVGQMPLGMYKDQLAALNEAQFDSNRDHARLNLELYPQFSEAARREQMLQAQMVRREMPQFAKVERQLTTKQRAGDVADFGRFAPQLSRLYGDMSPAYAGLDDAATEARTPSALLGKLNEGAMADNPLLSRLREDAARELELGGELSPEQARQAQQAARAAWSGRGLLYSNGASAAEVLSRDAVSQARLAERRNFAGGVLGLERADRASGAQIEALNQADAGGRASRLISINGAKMQPLLGLLNGRGQVNPGYATSAMGGAVGVGMPSAVMQGAPQMTGAAQALSPLYGYSQDVYDTNFNAAESRAMAQANAYTAAGGGMMKAGGGMY